MNIPIFQIDAFTDRQFGGNPAAVCPLERWLDDDVMQAIAMENNLAETAFFVKEETGYRIRWFTPQVEVDLCGHATLAAAAVALERYEPQSDSIAFHSRSGVLTVKRIAGTQFQLDFPADIPKPVPITNEMTAAFQIAPVEALRGITDLMLIFESEDQVRQARPDLGIIAALDCRGVIITARGNDCDFVSRFFAPQCGINEDPATGSAHTTLTPYWSKIIGKNTLVARQLSQREGALLCELQRDRILISGGAVQYMQGELLLSKI